MWPIPLPLERFQYFQKVVHLYLSISFVQCTHIDLPPKDEGSTLGLVTWGVVVDSVVGAKKAITNTSRKLTSVSNTRKQNW